jgi:putative FmdB family regulatory protein
VNYPYRCSACAHEFEVIKSVKFIDDPETCEKCNASAERYISSRQSFYGASDWDNAHFSPVLGEVVRNNAEVRRKAKERGLIEVGNEPVEKINSHFDKMRQKKSEQEYKQILDTSLGEINS